MRIINQYVDSPLKEVRWVHTTRIQTTVVPFQTTLVKPPPYGHLIILRTVCCFHGERKPLHFLEMQST